MNRKNATRILRTQIDKIDNIHHSEHRLFLDQTKTYIISFFSKDSHEYDYIKHFHFVNFNAIPIGSTEKGKTVDDLKNELKKFLNNCIETINNIDLYKPPVDNWFSKLPNWAINLGLPALCFISFGIGILFTNNTNSDLRDENSNLIKENKLLLSSSDSIANKYKDLSSKPKK